jgi:hypothetical protein
MLAKVFAEGDGVPFRCRPWKAWRELPPHSPDSFPALVLADWLRQPGNLRPGERKTVTVYHVPDGAKAPRHANGAPMTAIATVFQVAKRGGGN